jgi:hypothetical protein
MMNEENQNQPQMNADERRYKRSEIPDAIIGVFYEVYNELGFGFLETPPQRSRNDQQLRIHQRESAATNP